MEAEESPRPFCGIAALLGQRPTEESAPSKRVVWIGFGVVSHLSSAKAWQIQTTC